MVNRKRNKDKFMLTTNEVLQRLNVSNKTLSLLKKKGLPFYKLGEKKNSRCRYFWSDVVEWISEETRKYI